MKRLLFLSLLVFSTALSAQTAVGRLFYAPKDRARLDAEKWQRAVPDEITPPRHYQGWVRRSNGPATVWIDGVPEERANLSDPLAGERGNRQDLLRGGRIAVHPPRQPRTP
jgi:hypothetical protein